MTSLLVARLETQAEREAAEVARLEAAWLANEEERLAADEAARAEAARLEAVAAAALAAGATRGEAAEAALAAAGSGALSQCHGGTTVLTDAAQDENENDEPLAGLSEWEADLKRDLARARQGERSDDDDLAYAD